ncbi:hypothetical protein SO694_00006694 [Aureococcus anophagefferens]|uniref:Uncharacterized protein n=1 Tax=Aureococcus anophagefferens TaxID=44056 RepID=A0ABR1GAI5_AURAN
MESPVATKKKERPPHVGDNIVEFDVIKEQAQARAPRPARFETVKRSPSNIATETVAYWNAKTDGFVHHKYESRTVVCVVHAFGCAI